MVMSPPEVGGLRKRKGPVPRFVSPRPSVSFPDELDEQLRREAASTGEEYAEVVRDHVDYWRTHGGPDHGPLADAADIRSQAGQQRWPRRKSVGFTRAQVEALEAYQAAWKLPAFSDAVRAAVRFTRAHRTDLPVPSTVQRPLLPLTGHWSDTTEAINQAS